MNLSQIINLVIRIVMRRAINFGIGKGAAMVARKGGGKGGGGKAGAAGDAGQARSARETAKRARQAAKVTRRLGR